MFNWDKTTRFELEMKLLIDEIDDTWTVDEINDLYSFLNDYCDEDCMNIINKL